MLVPFIKSSDIKHGSVLSLWRDGHPICQIGEGVSNEWAWAVIACSLLMEFHGGSQEISILKIEMKFFSVCICVQTKVRLHMCKKAEKR
jgi:hypothetical protein